MIKELFLALTLGALLGFGITGTYMAVKKNQSPPLATTTQTSPTPSLANVSPVPTIASTNTTGHQLTVDSPENESVVTSSQITVKGSSSPLSSIVISTTTKTAYVNADNSGVFSYNVTLDSGVNLIQIDAIDSTDNLATTQLLVTYSTAKF